MARTTALTPEQVQMSARLKAAMRDSGKTEAAVAEELGVTQGQVSHWTNARLPVPWKRAQQLAEAVGIEDAAEISVEFRIATSAKADSAGSTGTSWANIAAFAQAVGLGDGKEAEEYEQAHMLKFRADSLRRKRLRPNTLGVVYGEGESMLPRIRSGDAILFDRGATKPVDEALFVVRMDGANNREYSVKRCRDFGDTIYFDALNPAGDHNWRKPRRMDDPKRPIEIVGRVRWIGSWED